jgi:hypothetical protein
MTNGAAQCVLQTDRMVAMKTLLPTLLSLCLLVASSAAETLNEKSPKQLATYELYSWQDSKGSWNFALLPTTSRLKTPEEIFDEKKAIRGVDKLKQRMSRLERPSRIVWIEKMVYEGAPSKGTERLAWPPKTIIEEVKQYGVARRVEVLGSPDFH